MPWLDKYVCTRSGAEITRLGCLGLFSPPPAFHAGVAGYGNGGAGDALPDDLRFDYVLLLFLQHFKVMLRF